MRIVKTERPQAPDAFVASEVAQFSSPWYRSFIAYDPRVELAKVKVPVLAINGDKDVQVIADQNLSAIAAALKPNPDVTIVKIPGLNHLFQTARTGALGEYGLIEETISPEVLALVSDWIAKRTPANPR